MAKKVVGTKGYVKVKKRKKRRLVKYVVAYAAIRTGVKAAEKLIDKYNSVPEISEDSEVLNYSLAFNGRNVKIENEPFNGAKINTICSGLKLDLSNAIIEEDVNIICKSKMSGISIVVPDNVKVDISSDSKLSAVANNVSAINDDTAPTIHIHTENIMTGIDVKAKHPTRIKAYKEDADSKEENKTETLDIE
ncbi:hypothetical protein QA584_11625 [Anaerocolumna sp. AGMB13025]|uniref:LiaF domain-containing protein n=1 Tax=Anaerocolumna sp. AGMB13025 TaxID=3039116 RepID=UPI00241D008F|nr:hypothetical protein [Anaerocolumna sp. AGMB13025]WFR59703.1 hypothetical protein QA584_11625 [Anaerocolumna sp. AGMB13025]